MEEQQNTPTTAAEMPKKSISGLAIAALVVGIVGLILSWMPIINNFAAVIAVIALILGIVGIVASGKNKAKSGRGIAVAAAIIAVVSLVVVMYTQSAYVAAIDSALDGPTGSVSSTAATDSSTEADSTSETSANSTAADTSTSSMTDLAIGTPVTYSDGMTVVVNSATTGLINYDGSEITGINVTYTYNGSSTGSFNVYDWKAQTAAGVLTSQSYYSDATDELSSGSLVSGGTITGNIYFDGNNVKAVYSPSLISDTNQASWIIG